MNAIAKSYWRSVKRETRKFSAVPAELREDVRALAAAEVEAGTLAEEAAKRLTETEEAEHGER